MEKKVKVIAPRSAFGLLETRPFSRLPTQLVRYLATFATTGEWGRLAAQLSDEDMRTMLSLAKHQVYTLRDEALFRWPQLLLRHMAEYSCDVIEELALNDVVMVPSHNVWKWWIAAPRMRRFAWIDGSEEFGALDDASDPDLWRALASWDKLVDLELMFPHVDAPVAELSKWWSARKQTLSKLTLFFATLLETRHVEQLLEAFPTLTKLSLSAAWFSRLWSRLPPSLTQLLLTVREPLDWPDVQQLVAFVRRKDFQSLDLGQAHLTLNVERKETAHALTLRFLHLYEWDGEDDSPAMEWTPQVLVRLVSDSALHWTSIDVRMPRFYVAVALAEWALQTEGASIDKLVCRRDSVLAAEDDTWAPAEGEPWIDDASVRIITRALAAGRLGDVMITNHDDDVEDENVPHELRCVVRVDEHDASFLAMNLSFVSLAPWLNRVRPRRTVQVQQTTSDELFRQNELDQFCSGLKTRKDPLEDLCLGYTEAMEHPGYLSMTECGDLDWLPVSLRALKIEAYPLHNVDDFCTRVVPRLTQLRKVTVASRRALTESHLLSFPTQLVHMAWYVRAADVDEKKLLTPATLVRLAERYTQLEALHLDVRPTAWTAQPPETREFWAQWLARLPRLEHVTLALDSPSFTLDEERAFEHLSTAVLRFDSTRPHAWYHRYACPLDIADRELKLMCSGGDDQTAVDSWSVRLAGTGPPPLVYGRDLAKLMWPYVEILNKYTSFQPDLAPDLDPDRAIELRAAAAAEAWRAWKEFLAKHFPLGAGRRFVLYRLSRSGLRYMVDHERNTIEWIDAEADQTCWRHIDIMAQHDGRTRTPGWPRTWFKEFAPPMPRDIDNRDVLGDTSAAMYLLMRMLNPDVPPQRIGQALLQPDSGEFMASDFVSRMRFNDFYFARERRLLNDLPPAAASAMEKKATTATRLGAAHISRALVATTWRDAVRKAVADNQVAASALNKPSSHIRIRVRRKVVVIELPWANVSHHQWIRKLARIQWPDRRIEIRMPRLK